MYRNTYRIISYIICYDIIVDTDWKLIDKIIAQTAEEGNHVFLGHSRGIFTQKAEQLDLGIHK